MISVAAIKTHSTVAVTRTNARMIGISFPTLIPIRRIPYPFFEFEVYELTTLSLAEDVM